LKEGLNLSILDEFGRIQALAILIPEDNSAYSIRPKKVFDLE